MAEDWKDGADAKWIVLKRDCGASAKSSALNDRHDAAKTLVDCLSASVDCGSSEIALTATSRTSKVSDNCARQRRIALCGAGIKFCVRSTRYSTRSTLYSAQSPKSKCFVLGTKYSRLGR